MRDSRRDLFAYTCSKLCHEILDVAVALPWNINDLIDSNFITGIGQVSFPTLMEDFKRDCLQTFKSWTLVKNGIATGLSTAGIDSIDQTSVTILGKEHKPVVFHGDSGALWTVLNCPNFKQYEGKIFGVTSQVAIECVDNCVKVRGIVVSIWSCFGWLHDEVDVEDDDSQGEL